MQMKYGNFCPQKFLEYDAENESQFAGCLSLDVSKSL